MARTYRRDKNGKFSGGGGSSGGGGASAGGVAKKGPKTAAGRASANLKEGEKGRRANPMDKKAANKAITAAAAKDYYKTMGGGRKGAAKPAKKAAPAKAAPAKAAPKTAPKAKAAEAPKATAAHKKKALIRDASSKVLAGKGKEVGAARRGYIRAQQEESLRMEKTGKGSKAKRRMAKK